VAPVFRVFALYFDGLDVEHFQPVQVFFSAGESTAVLLYRLPHTHTLPVDITPVRNSEEADGIVSFETGAGTTALDHGLVLRNTLPLVLTPDAHLPEMVRHGVRRQLLLVTAVRDAAFLQGGAHVNARVLVLTRARFSCNGVVKSSVEKLTCSLDTAKFVDILQRVTTSVSIAAIVKGENLSIPACVVNTRACVDSCKVVSLCYGSPIRDSASGSSGISVEGFFVQLPLNHRSRDESK